MESQEGTEKKFIPKSWHKCVILFFLLMCFLMLGSFAFCAVEREHSKNVQRQFIEGLEKFLYSHPCVSPSELWLSGSNVSYYLSKGVSLRRRYRIDTKANEIESTWSLSTAFMLALTIITTIGYGDTVPRTTAGKLFCIGYAMAGIPLMAWTLSVFGKTLEGFARKYTNKLDPSQTKTRCGKLCLMIKFLFTFVLLILILIVLPGYLVSIYERWNFWESCYFFFVTITTIGFGDLTVGDCQRCGSSLYLLVLFFTFYVFIGMTIISFLFTAVTNYHKRKLQMAESLLATFVLHRNESAEVQTSGKAIPDQIVLKTPRIEGTRYNKRAVARVHSRSSSRGLANEGLERDKDECDVPATSSSVSYTFVQYHPRKANQM